MIQNSFAANMSQLKNITTFEICSCLHNMTSAPPDPGSGGGRPHPQPAFHPQKLKQGGGQFIFKRGGPSFHLKDVHKAGTDLCLWPKIREVNQSFRGPAPGSAGAAITRFAARRESIRTGSEPGFFGNACPRKFLRQRTVLIAVTPNKNTVRRRHTPTPGSGQTHHTVSLSAATSRASTATILPKSENAICQNVSNRIKLTFPAQDAPRHLPQVLEVTLKFLGKFVPLCWTHPFRSPVVIFWEERWGQGGA